VDWSHSLLTDPERVLFRRLAVFAGGFDLDAAHEVGAASETERYQLLDQLGLLVDKSLVIAEQGRAGSMRYRLLETVRQYALDKLGESGEADQVRTRHRDHYATVAAALDVGAQAGPERLLQWADVEIDNLYAAFAWSREIGDDQTALQLVSSLQPYWLERGRTREGLAGFDAVLTDQCPPDIAPAVWVRGVADAGSLTGWVETSVSPDRARQALDTARELGEPALIARALAGCGVLALENAEVAGPYLAEAIDLVRAAGDRWSLCQLLSYQTCMGVLSGDPTVSCAAGEQGRDLADALGDRFVSRNCRSWLGSALWMQGDLTHAAHVLGSMAEEAEADGDLVMTVFGFGDYARVLAYQGQADAARAAAESALKATYAMGEFYSGAVYAMLACAELAGGDTAAARQAVEAAYRHPLSFYDVFARSLIPLAEAALAGGDVVTARRGADDTVAIAPGWWQLDALTVRAFVALAQGEPDQAEQDAHDALGIAARTQGYLRVPDTLECLARLADDQHYASRLLGAAQAARERTGEVRFPMYQDGYDVALTAVRDAPGHSGFDAAWAEGAALSTEEAIAYAQRGRGQRKRPSSGWESLTPTELDVVRLVSDGLVNKDIATRLFISPRTVQTHLTHVYNKLGLTSRVRLVQEAARHT